MRNGSSKFASFCPNLNLMKLVPALFRSANVLELAAPARE